MKAFAIAAVAVAVGTLAACGHSAAPASAPAPAPAPATRSATAPAAAPDPSPSPTPVRRLTIRQARAAYGRIVDPSNRANDLVSEDQTDDLPLSKFHADVKPNLRLTRSAARHMRAVRWPRSVQPYATAMVLSVFSDDERCLSALLKAPDYDAVNAAYDSNEACIAATGDDSDATTIRERLGLPPVSS